MQTPSTNISFIDRTGLTLGKNNRTPVHLSQEQCWQPLLWKTLVRYNQSLALSPWHRANLCDAFITALNKEHGHLCTEKLPNRLFIFGISTLPPMYLRAIHAISQHIHVYFFIHNPCQYYWEDIKQPDFSFHQTIQIIFFQKHFKNVMIQQKKIISC